MDSGHRYSGAFLQGTSWGWALKPLIQWSLSTRDKLGMGLKPLIQWSLSTRDKLGMGLKPLIQWSLSTRDKLGMGLKPLIQWSLSTRDKLGTSPASTARTHCYCVGVKGLHSLQELDLGFLIFSRVLKNEKLAAAMVIGRLINHSAGGMNVTTPTHLCCRPFS